MNTINENINDKILKKKFTKSISGRQCISPCFAPGTKIIHPNTLDETIGINKSFCAVSPFIKTDLISGKTSIEYIDDCYPPEINIDYVDKMDLLTPLFEFNSEYFIKIYYKINSIDETMNWINENKQCPYKTKVRVFNNSMVIFGDNINIMDIRLHEFIYDIIIYNFNKIYKEIKIFFQYNYNFIKLIKKKYSKYNKNKSKNLSLFIKKKFIKLNNIQIFLSNFYRYHFDKLKNINITNILINYMIKHIIKRITITLKKNDNKKNNYRNKKNDNKKI